MIDNSLYSNVHDLTDELIDNMQFKTANYNQNNADAEKDEYIQRAIYLRERNLKCEIDNIDRKKSYWLEQKHDML